MLALFAPEAAARELAKYARWTRLLLCLRALRRAKLPRQTTRRHYETHARKVHLSYRRLAGGPLRRALKGRTPINRAHALYAVLADAEYWIARLVRRMERGFSKLRRLRRQPRSARIVFSRVAAPACGIDSSYTVRVVPNLTLERPRTPAARRKRARSVLLATRTLIRRLNS